MIVALKSDGYKRKTTKTIQLYKSRGLKGYILNIYPKHNL